MLFRAGPLCCALGSRAGESAGSNQEQNITEWNGWGTAGTGWSQEVVSPREELAEDSQLRKRKERSLGGKMLWADRVLLGYIVSKNLPYFRGVCYMPYLKTILETHSVSSKKSCHTSQAVQEASTLVFCIVCQGISLQYMIHPLALWFTHQMHPLGLKHGHLTTGRGVWCKKEGERPQVAVQLVLASCWSHM